MPNISQWTFKVETFCWFGPIRTLAHKQYTHFARPRLTLQEGGGGEGATNAKGTVRKDKKDRVNYSK